jgi:hypothetical protein
VCFRSFRFIFTFSKLFLLQSHLKDYPQVFFSQIQRRYPCAKIYSQTSYVHMLGSTPTVNRQPSSPEGAGFAHGPNPNDQVTADSVFTATLSLCFNTQPLFLCSSFSFNQWSLLLYTRRTKRCLWTLVDDTVHFYAHAV